MQGVDADVYRSISRLYAESCAASGREAEAVAQLPDPIMQMWVVAASQTHSAGTLGFLRTSMQCIEHALILLFFPCSHPFLSLVLHNIPWSIPQCSRRSHPCLCLRPPPLCPLRLMDHPQLQNVARTLAFNSRLARQLQAHDKGASAAALQGSIEDLGSVIKSMMSL